MALLMTEVCIHTAKCASPNARTKRITKIIETTGICFSAGLVSIAITAKFPFLGELMKKMNSVRWPVDIVNCNVLGVPQVGGRSTKKLFVQYGIAVAAVAVTMGCATAPENAPRFTAAPAAPDGYATVYVYRLGAPPYTRAIKLSIAGKPVLDAPEQAYTWVFVRAGTHTVFAEWPTDFLAPKKWPDASATRAFESGLSYYFRVAGNVGTTPGGFFSSGGMMLTSFVAQQTPEVGKAELVGCCRHMRSATERVD
jgi:hypothetical protein